MRQHEETMRETDEPNADDKDLAEIAAAQRRLLQLLASAVSKRLAMETQTGDDSQTSVIRDQEEPDAVSTSASRNITR